MFDNLDRKIHDVWMFLGESFLLGWDHTSLINKDEDRKALGFLAAVGIISIIGLTFQATKMFLKGLVSIIKWIFR